MKLRTNATNRPRATVFAPCCSKNRCVLARRASFKPDPPTVASGERVAPPRARSSSRRVRQRSSRCSPRSTTPTTDSVPRPASAAAVTSAVSPGHRHTCRLDHQKHRDQHVAVLGDPLIYDVEHPLVTDPGGGGVAGTTAGRGKDESSMDQSRATSASLPRMALARER